MTFWKPGGKKKSWGNGFSFQRPIIALMTVHGKMGNMTWNGRTHWMVHAWTDQPGPENTQGLVPKWPVWVHNPSNGWNRTVNKRAQHLVENGPPTVWTCPPHVDVWHLAHHYISLVFVFIPNVSNYYFKASVIGIHTPDGREIWWKSKRVNKWKMPRLWSRGTKPSTPSIYLKWQEKHLLRKC